MDIFKIVVTIISFNLRYNYCKFNITNDFISCDAIKC